MNYFHIFVYEKSLRHTLLTNLFMKRTIFTARPISVFAL